MRKIKEASITSEKLTHMTHTGDLFLFGEAAGRFAIKALVDIFNALRGSGLEDLNVTLKIDGSPSVLLASDFYGETFVATKGFFAKDRKIAYTTEDCEKYYGHAPDLQYKMEKLLEYARAINIPKDQIWQGDFLFDRNSLKEEVIDGEKCLTFHPNTIVYAIPLKDPQSLKIQRADIGVAWHTVYTGPDFEHLKIGFGADVNNLNKVPSVFQMDSKIPGIGESSTLSGDDAINIQKSLEVIEEGFQQLISSGVIKELSEDENLRKYIMTYKNYIIKNKNTEVDPEYIQGMIEWLSASFDKEIAKKKTQAAKDKYETKKQEEISKIKEKSADIEALLQVQNEAVAVKEFLINKLSKLGSFKTLVKHVDKGFLPTGHEGFAVSDKEGNIQKFVSRLEFSKNNFSQEILKGWMSAARLQQSIRRIVKNRMKENVDEQDITNLVKQIVQKLEAAAPSMSKEQLTSLKNEMLSLIGEEVNIMVYLEPLMNLFSKFKVRLQDLFYNTFRMVDDDVLKVFMESALKDPIISKEYFMSARNNIRNWQDPVVDRLNQLGIPSGDRKAILTAVGKSYNIVAGGNAGMGKGEVQYALLCGGEKPKQGDLFVPGLGEIEIKGVVGRMRGVHANLGNNRIPDNMIKKFVNSIPELKELHGVSADIFSLRKTDSRNSGWDIIIKNTGEKAKDIISQIFTLWTKGSYGDSFEVFKPDMSLIDRASDAILERNWMKAAACQAALQFDIYKKADGFMGILFVSPTRFFFAETPDDIIKGVMENKLQITPASVSLSNNIGSAAGLNIPQK